MEHSLEVLLSGAQFRRLLEIKLAPLEKTYGLCRIDMQILLYLSSAGPRNTASDIAALGLFTKGHVSQSLERLHRLALIAAAPDAADHRCRHLRLTPAADALVEKVRAVCEAVDAAVPSPLTPEEIRVFCALAQKLNRGIQDALDGAEHLN